jgi:MYXO-CTERM domain-containing protein
VIDPTMPVGVDAGTDASIAGDSGSFVDASSGDAAMDVATSTDARRDARADGSIGPEPGGGCACRADATPRGGRGARLAALFVIGAFAVRRRRRA